MNFLKTIFGKYFGFNKLEKTIFEALLNTLSEEGREVLNSQIKEINKVMRHSEGDEVLFYKVSFNRVNHDFSKIFSFDEEIQLLAEVKISYFDRVVPARVWMFNGVVYRFEYDKAITTMVTYDNYSIVSIEIVTE